MEESTEDDTEKFLDEHAWPQVTWYWNKAYMFERRSTIWTWLGIAFGFLATIVAAFPRDPPFLKGVSWVNEIIGWVVVVLSAAATLVAGTVIPRYRTLAKTREAGRVRSTLIAKLAQVELPALTGEELRKRKLQIVKDLMSVDDEYGMDHSPDKDENSRRAKSVPKSG